MLLIQAHTPYTAAMSTSKVMSAIPYGYASQKITVEGDSNQGLPSFTIIGLPSRIIEESRERIKSAIRNSGFIFPRRKLIINLAPAGLAKSSSSLDLPIAIAILLLSEQLLPSDLVNRMFAGELSLDGQITPVRGIISIIECAIHNHAKEIIISAGNAAQASLVADQIRVIPVQNLRELWLYLKQKRDISPLGHVVKNTKTDKHEHYLLDQIAGQTQAKRALIIAIAGHHNLLLSGPPGTGKTMLARTAVSLLPPLSPTEQIAITKLHSLTSNTQSIIAERPFRSPHHSATRTAIIGGTAQLLPGEISLAHLGVLYLDELPEFDRNALEALRQPLEDHKITLSYIRDNATYPADFMLIATMNPCPCGYFGSDQKTCTCTPSQLQNYQKKLSGPLFDRIDMNVEMHTQDNSVLLKNTTLSTHQHASAKLQIKHALNTQFMRYAQKSKFNAHLTSPEIKQYLTLTPAAEQTLNLASSRLSLSSRAYMRVIKVAQTIVDLDSPLGTPIDAKHIAEALHYREQR